MARPIPRLSPALLVVTIMTLVSLHVPVTLAHEGEGHVGDVRVSGIVTDAETGDPIEGVRVTGHASGDGFAAKDSDATDAAGRYTMYLTHGRGELHLSADGYEDRWEPFEVDGETSRDVALDAVPPPDATLVGRILDSDGKPVASARVTLQGEYRYYPYADDGGEEPSTAVVGEADSASPGMTRPMPPRRDAWQEVTTDADGRYRFEAYSGEKRLGVEAKGFAVESVTVTLEAGENFRDVHLEKVPPSNAVLRGRVVDRETRLPVAGASVNVHNAAWSDYRWASTDEKGEFTVQLRPGYARVDVYTYHDVVAVAESLSSDVDPVGSASTMPRHAGTSRAYYSFATTLVLKEGENDLAVELKPRPLPTVVVTGYVVDEAKQAGIAGAWVNVRNEDTGEWGHAQTDVHGSFRFLVRPGALVVDAGAQGYFANVAMREASEALRVDLSLTAGESRWAPCDECDVYAEKGARDIGGERAAESDGAPATTFGEARSSADDAEGEAAYVGSGGGLGPYSPASAETDEPTSRATPATGFGALVGAFAVAAVAFRGRRRL